MGAHRPSRVASRTMTTESFARLGPPSQRRGRPMPSGPPADAEQAASPRARGSP